MIRLRNIIIVAIAFFSMSCRQQKLLISFGTEDRLLCNSDSIYTDGKIIFKVQDFSFFFKIENFKDLMNEEYDIDFPPFSYLKEFSLNYLNGKTLEITKINSSVLINNKEIKFPLAYDIESILDGLVKRGMFYVELNNEPIKAIEYRYWLPQYQGSIYSKWIINKRVINESIWGFVD